MTREDRERNLRSALLGLAEETAGLEAPDMIRQRLRAEVGRRRRPKRALGYLAVAAALVIGVFLGVRWQQARQSEDSAAKGAAGSLQPVARPVLERGGDWSSQELTPWYYNESMPPVQRAYVVRVEIRSDAAAKFGVYTTGRAVPAEVLMGEDGLARAVRFVRNVDSTKQSKQQGELQ